MSTVCTRIAASTTATGSATVQTALIKLADGTLDRRLVRVHPQRETLGGFQEKEGNYESHPQIMILHSGLWFIRGVPPSLLGPSVHRHREFISHRLVGCLRSQSSLVQ